MTGVDEIARAATATPGRVPRIVAVAAAGAYVLLAVATHLRVLDPVDVAVRHAARPGGWWGPEQIEASRVVSAMTPQRFALLLLLVVTTLAVVRRSLRPLAVTGLVGGLVVLATFATKWGMAHIEAGSTPVRHGAFPSGHTVTAVVCPGLAVLLLGPGPRLRWLLPVVTGAVMGTALVFADVHPATDVLGGGLLAASALVGATAAGLGPWARRRNGTAAPAGRAGSRSQEHAR